MKFIEKFSCDPITGHKPFGEEDLIDLKLHKNQDGLYHCPVLFKPFTENSHIVCIKRTGNVFSYEAVDELNLKTKNYRDLLTDEPFTRKDLIILQDPLKTDKLMPAEFHHFKHKLRWASDDSAEVDARDPKNRLKRMDSVTKATLEELKDTYESSGSISSEVTGASTSSKSDEEEPKRKSDIFNAALYSTGKVAASITSTVMETHTSLEAATLSGDVVKYSRVKKKGYAQMETSHGPLNLELYCQWAPKTCDNFFRLSRDGYYDGTLFHRLIKHFMIQGGDPTATGSGGNSCWGKPFEDELNQHLSHEGRGILSMANSGPNSNKSQFFITFRSCKHLDRKHSVS